MTKALEAFETMSESRFIRFLRRHPSQESLPIYVMLAFAIAGYLILLKYHPEYPPIWGATAGALIAVVATLSARRWGKKSLLYRTIGRYF